MKDLMKIKHAPLSVHMCLSQHVVPRKISQFASQYRSLNKCTCNSSAYMVADKLQFGFTRLLDLMLPKLGDMYIVSTFLTDEVFTYVVAEASIGATLLSCFA